MGLGDRLLPVAGWRRLQDEAPVEVVAAGGGLLLDGGEVLAQRHQRLRVLPPPRDLRMVLVALGVARDDRLAEQGLDPQAASGRCDLCVSALQDDDGNRAAHHTGIYTHTLCVRNRQDPCGPTAAGASSTVAFLPPLACFRPGPLLRVCRIHGGVPIDLSGEGVSELDRSTRQTYARPAHIPDRKSKPHLLLIGLTKTQR